MNILIIGNFSTGWDGSICDELHIASALEDLGHGVTRLQRGVNMAVAPNLYDFTLIAQWDGYGDVSHLSHPLVYWAFDYQADGQEWHEKLIKESDLYLSKRIADSKYPNWQWLSQDFSPPFLAPHKSAIKGVKRKKDIDVLFTGSYLPWAEERNKTLQAIDDKFNLVIHSVNGWPETFKDVRGPVMDDALPELISRTRINISIDHTIERGYWSDRNSQILACGGVVLFRHIPLSETVFKDHVFYFNNEKECLGMIERALQISDKELDQMGERNAQYAFRYLRVHNRVQDMLILVKGIL